MRLTLWEGNTLSIDGTHVGSVAQRSEGTRVCLSNGDALALPENRYMLSAKNGNYPLPGRKQFNADVIMALGRAGWLKEKGKLKEME